MATNEENKFFTDSSDKSDEEKTEDSDYQLVTSIPSISGEQQQSSLLTSDEFSQLSPLINEHQQSLPLTNYKPKTSLPEGFIERGSYCLSGTSNERLRGVFRKNADVLDIVYLDGEVLYTATSICFSSHVSDVFECESSDVASEIHFKLGDEHYEFKMKENKADLMYYNDNLVALYNLSDYAFGRITPLDLRKKLFLFNRSHSAEMVVKHPDIECSLLPHSSEGESEGGIEADEKIKEDNLIFGFSESEQEFYKRLEYRQSKPDFYFFTDMVYIAHKQQLLQKINVLLPRKYYYQAIYFRLVSVLLDKMISPQKVSLADWVGLVKSQKDLHFLTTYALKKLKALLGANPIRVTPGTEFKLTDLVHACISIDLAKVRGKKHYINVIMRTIKWITNGEVTESEENSFVTSLRYFYKKRIDFLSDENILVYPASILKNLRYPHDFDWMGEIPEGFINLDKNKKQFLALDLCDKSESFSNEFKYFTDMLEKGGIQVAVKKNYVQPVVYNYYAFDYCLLKFLFDCNWVVILSQEEKGMKKMAEELLKEVKKCNYDKVLDFVFLHLDPDVNCPKIMRDLLLNFKVYF